MHSQVAFGEAILSLVKCLFIVCNRHKLTMGKGNPDTEVNIQVQVEKNRHSCKNQDSKIETKIQV